MHNETGNEIGNRSGRQANNHSLFIVRFRVQFLVSGDAQAYSKVTDVYWTYGMCSGFRTPFADLGGKRTKVGTLNKPGLPVVPESHGYSAIRTMGPTKVKCLVR